VDIWVQEGNFHGSDVATAYNIKKRIGYGSIYKVKDKRVYKLSIIKGFDLL